MTHQPPAAVPGPHVLIAQDRTGAWTWTCKAATGVCYSGRSGLNETTATAEGRAHAETHSVRVMKWAYEGPVDTGLPDAAHIHPDAWDDAVAIDQHLHGDLALAAGILHATVAELDGWLTGGTVPAAVHEQLMRLVAPCSGWTTAPAPTATVMQAVA